MARATAQQVVLEIIRKADGELTGKTRLFKAFYFAHLAYYDKNVGVLSDWPIARMPQGPGIHNSQQLFDSLTTDGLLEIEHTHDGFYPEYRYRLTDKAKMLAPLWTEADAAIQRAVEFVQAHRAYELSHYTHENSRSWLQGKDGDILDIYIDLIPEDEYQRRERDMDDLDQRLKSALAVG